MGLFDDLLKKPTANPPADTGTPSTGGNPPATGGAGNPLVNDPLAAMTPQPIQIQKSEEISITTESAAETAPSTPPPVTVMAESDASSILISSSTPADSPIIVTSAPEVTSSPIVTTTSESLISNVEVSAPAPTITKTPEVVDLGNLFGETKTEEASIVSPVSIEEVPEVVSIESTPIVEESITVVESTPIVEESITVVESTPIVEEVTPIVASSTPIETTVIPEAIAIESSLTVEEPTITVEAPVETPVETPLVSESVIDFDSEATEELVAEESYEHPSEFISASIARIDAMIARIDTAHGTKLSEALGYKTEKEKYTALEEQAYADAEKYVTEKDHALSMRNYFVDQGKAAGVKIESKTSEPVASVETTLTGLAVQNAVSETVKHEKKTKAKKQEEEVGLLGL